MRTVVITGCNGLVGNFVARKFLSSGWRVRGIRRETSNLHLVADISSRIEWVSGDVLDPLFLQNAFAHADAVVHAAAIVSFSPAARQPMRQTNVEGTAHVVNVCLAQRIPKLCFISSVAALGRKKPDSVLDETAAWEQSKFNSHYAFTKYQAEMEVWRGIAEGLPGVIVNPSIILGPGDWHSGSTRLFKYAWDERPFYPGGSLNYVDVRDVAEIVFRLINSEISSERFILNAGNVTYRAFLNRVAERFGKKKPFLRIRPWMSRLAWQAEWMRSLATGRDPLVTRETARMAQYSFTYTNEKITRTLPYTFKSLDETIAWTCSALKNQLSDPVSVHER